MSSLADQTYHNFEIIVVDQNDDGRVRSLLQPYLAEIQIVYLTTSRGASHARNVGLTAVSGNLISFPDDDCWYVPTFLEQATELLRAHAEWDGLVGRPIEPDGRTAGRQDKCGGRITRYNVWTRGIASTIVLRNSVIDAVGDWDVSLGPGAPTGLGGSDETDYLIRALDRGSHLHYDPALVVYHPDPASYDSAAGQQRGYSYGRSMGSVLRKHSYPSWYLAYALLRPIGGTLLWLLRRRFRRALFHWSVFRGRFLGLMRPSIH
jgi:glycosyltransferase involved in cell wall biosynthesis